MEPYWQSDDGRHVLYCGDCLEVLPQIQGVDAVVTDPPYGTKTDQRDEWMVGEFSNVLPLALPLIRKALVANGAFYCFTSWTMMAEWLLRYQQYFKLQNILIWDKRRHSGCYSPHAWQYTWEGVFFGIKGRREIREYLPDILLSWEHEKRLAMQKPVDIQESMIRASTDQGDMICDPFMGTGGAGVACIRTGRRFIGIEIEPKYCEIAVKRMERELAQPKLPIMEPERHEQMELAIA